MEPDSEYGAHRGLHNLGIEYVNGVGGGVDRIDSEPVGDADDRPEIARIPDAVKGKE